MQTQTIRRLGFGRYSTALIVTIAGTALLVAVALGVVILTGNDAAPAVSVDTVQVYEDPPLPAGWRDSYFMPKSGAYTEDPPLPAGWSDSYFWPRVGGYTEDPPLPAGWTDPYFSGVYTSGD